MYGSRNILIQSITGMTVQGMLTISQAGAPEQESTGRWGEAPRRARELLTAPRSNLPSHCTVKSLTLHNSPLNVYNSNPRPRSDPHILFHFDASHTLHHSLGWAYAVAQKCCREPTSPKTPSSQQLALAYPTPTYP